MSATAFFAPQLIIQDGVAGIEFYKKAFDSAGGVMMMALYM